MLRHIAGLILLSVVALFVVRELTLLLNMLLYLHNLLAHFLNSVFSNSAAGRLFSRALSLMLTPLLVTALPGFIYWLITRRDLHYIYVMAWIIWLMLVTTLTLHR